MVRLKMLFGVCRHVFSLAELTNEIHLEILHRQTQIRIFPFFNLTKSVPTTCHLPQQSNSNLKT